MTVRRLILLVVACAGLATPVQAQRLPTAVTPEHYDLTFAIDLAQERFDGRTVIDIRVVRPTREIRLHAVDLEIRSASVSSGRGTQRAAVRMNPTDQTATLTVPTVIAAGTARIDIEYGAPLNKQLRGLYLSKSRNRSYAVTQFESTDARRAFPCFDEPSFKATFALTVIADRGDTAISNGRIVSDTPGPAPAQHTMKFSPTAKMSSYLVAMAVGDFQCLEGGADGVPIRICATPDKKELGHIALEAAQFALSFLNRYHTIKYPFGKLDVVAVPDFAAGAMENTAAIFYRETDLLADSATASPATRKTIVTILSHEMAHQWFGDLVTMRWWDDLWLNEGFATWMETRPAAEWKPEWHMDVEEAADGQTALHLDSLTTTHPIHAAAETPDEIEAMFDPIAYQKGAAVLRMVEAYIGEEAFRTGVNAYLEKHAYANATSEDFFAALTSASGKPVDRVMGTFVMQAGVPQVDVALECANGRPRVTLAQRRFLQTPSAPAGAGRERWQIPVCLKLPDAATPTCVLFTEATQTVNVGDRCPRWVFANAGGKGYYRTAYPDPLIKAIAPDIESALTAPERLSLVADGWALVRAGRHSIRGYLDLAAGFGREPLAQVLEVATQPLGFIDDYLTTAATRLPFRAFVTSLLQPLYRDLGFEGGPGDGEDRRASRNVVLRTLGGVADDPDVAARARRAVDAALTGGPALDPITAGTIVQIAAAHGDAKLFDALVAASARATSPQEHYRYLYALAAFRDPALIDRALERARSPELRSQDTALYLASFFDNDAARDRAWTFVKPHWSEIEPKVKIAGGDVTLVSRLSRFCSAEARDDIRSFFAAHPLPAAERALRQIIEQIDACIEIQRRQQPDFEAWLTQRIR